MLIRLVKDELYPVFYPSNSDSVLVDVPNELWASYRYHLHQVTWLGEMLEDAYDSAYDKTYVTN